MDALFRQGRPKKVQLCVLIDRGHRELPVEATFVGRKAQTTEQEIIKVQLREVDDVDKVWWWRSGTRAVVSRVNESEGIRPSEPKLTRHGIWV